MRSLSESYIAGIREGRECLKREGMKHAGEHLDNLNRVIKGFGADNPVGQMYRGERDFWKNQLKKWDFLS